MDVGKNVEELPYSSVEGKWKRLAALIQDIFKKVLDASKPKRKYWIKF